MKIKVPYGKEYQEVTVEDARVLGVVEPNPVPRRDEEKLFHEALAAPLGGPAFDAFVADARDLLVIINDATRPTPTARVMDFLVPVLSRVREKVTLIVATGIHRAPTEDEYRQMLGRHYGEWRARTIAHDSRKDEEMVSIGRSKQGTEMSVNRRGVEAHKIVVIGSVEPHYFAGFTGGRKAFLPGIASYHTIEQNHKHALRLEARSLALDGNPVHEDMIDALGTIAQKPIFSIMTVLDRDHHVYAVTAGDIHRSFYAAIEAANEVFAVKVPGRAAVVVTVAPYPMDIDLYQSQKALDNGKLALQEGGILILVSKCRTGVGEEAFLELLSSAPTPQGVLEKLGHGYRLGYHKAGKMAEIALTSEMWGVTDLDPGILKKIFITAKPTVQQAVDEALRKKGPDAKVLFLTSGSITVPLVP